MNPSRESLLRGVLFVAGPTASGKTAAAIALAEACGGEIVGADAFQVYRALPVLTARPSPEELARAPHHLVAVVPPEEEYSVARYLEDALAAIAEIKRRGKTPIVAGGTGLYLRALMRGLSDAPPGDPGLRAELSALPLDEAIARLADRDPEAAATVDLRNPRRVIRALEVCLLTGRPFSSFRQWEEPAVYPGIVLQWDREELHRRINERTAAMFRAGVVDEVREARASGTIGPTASQVIGWREIGALLDGSMTEATCREAIAQATRQYAKRQLTWFRRETGLTPMPLSARKHPDFTELLRSC